MLAEVPPEEVLRRALFLTNGNAKELREGAPLLLDPTDPLGLSMGHKAQAALVARHNAGEFLQ